MNQASSDLELSYRLSSTFGDSRDKPDLSQASQSAFHYDLFLGDIIVRGSGVDLSAAWEWVPVLDFAICLRTICKELRQSQAEVFEFTESEATLSFEHQDGTVRVSASYAPGVISTTLETLTERSEQLFKAMVAEFSAAHPELSESPYFRGLQQEAQLTPKP